jgi:filamentous hemagglutinin family protein
MNNVIDGPVRDATIVTLSLLAWNLAALPAEANPTGGAVTQGSATISSAGSQLTVTTATTGTAISWQTFNVGTGETTTFVEPSSTSVVWNYINDSNPSQILGTVNANGYVVLQNANGFVVGGNAAIKAAGLVMTTSASSVPTLSSGGAWEFDSPPPSAKIINYGQITVAGGPVYLIASDIVNEGTITAEKGQIGLYDGKEVLVSTSAAGTGLSARVTLPAGSVDNEGKLIADGGAIAAMAQTINNNGLVQANSVENVNGVVELVASGNLTMGANSDVEANGDSTASSASPGGFAVLQAGGSYSDTSTSKINVTGANGGQDGIIEVLGSNLTGAASLQSQIGDNFALLVNPYDITLSQNSTGTSYDANNNLDANFNVSDLAAYAQIDLHTLDNIELSTAWTLTDPSVNNTGAWGSLSLSAGNNIILDDNSGLVAAKNWNVNLTAGTSFDSTSGSKPASGSDGIYLGDGQGNGGYIQTQNGDINLWAANEVLIADVQLGNGITSGSITTMGGGSINVTAEYGDVNAGNNINGYDFGQKTAPYYKVDADLGGISTGDGGNVTISAGGDVIAYLPTQNDYNNYGSKGDAGVGAFGSEAGNVTVTAGGSVYGNYVVANGTGVIAAGANAGSKVSLTDLDADFALSLIKGSWTVNAENIYLDDVINPNGVFNDSTTRLGKVGAHYFDYDANDSVSLIASDAVEITGAEVPLTPTSDTSSFGIPVLLPPSLEIVTGAGGLTLDCDVILFPSAEGNLNITTTDGGNFESRENPNDTADLNTYTIEMSASAADQWTQSGDLQTETFGIGDRGTTALEVNNDNPVEVNISGSMNDVNLYTTKETKITVDGNMFNSSFVGEDLHASDTTTINVAGSISYSPVYEFTTLSTALSSDWASIFALLVDDNPNDANSVANAIPLTDIGNSGALKNLLASELLFSSADPNPGFVYNPTTKQLGYAFQMSSFVRAALEGTLVEIVEGANGVPEVYQAANGSYYFVTKEVSFVSASVIETLYQDSLSSVKDAQSLPVGFQIGGPGALDLTAGSLDLGSSFGIVSWGSADAEVQGGVNYAALANVTDNAGASVDVTVKEDIGMLTSTIATIDGGNVTVSSGGEIDLGLAGVPFQPFASGNLAFGIYTAGVGDVTVTAENDINIDTARIATFNGGNVFVESYDGNINAGNGVNEDLLIPYYWYDTSTGIATEGAIQGPRPYGSGILALAPTKEYQVPAGSTGDELPGNITVETPNGNIVSTQGGIAQFALDGNVAGGPTITLVAGTAGVAASATEGNIELGQGGVIGGTVNLTAQGNISGLIVSRQNTTVKSEENVDVTVLSSGSANVQAVGTLTGTLIGETGVNASGGAGITATMLSSSVSANGATGQNSLGTATVSTASQSAANTSSADAKQEVAGNTDTSDDDQNKKPALTQRVKRVTVILPPKV